MSAAFIQVYLRLDFIMEDHGSKRYEPWGGSLIWVHTVCNIGHLKHKQKREQITKVVPGKIRVKCI